MKPNLLTLTLLAITSKAALADYALDVHLDKPDGYYKISEEAVCTFTLLKDGQPAVGEKLRCTVKQEREIRRREELVCDGKALQIRASIDRPGWLYFGFEIIGPDGKPLQGKGIYKHSHKPTIVGEIGAMYDAHKIKALDSRPADFDAYWAACRTKLDQVPLDPKLTEIDVPRTLRSKVMCYAVEVKCLGRTPVTGYLAVPIGAKPNSLPAYVGYQSRVWQDASRARANEMASKGVLALYVTWHGLPTGSADEFYQQMSQTWYEEGGIVGDTNHDTWFGHDMYLRAMRALDFIKSRPEWNHKQLVASGGSLGGIQAIAAAALDRDVTIAVVSVPTGCEYNGYKQGRDAAGHYRGKSGIARLEADPRRAVTLAYHEAVNFAPRIQCDTACRLPALPSRFLERWFIQSQDVLSTFHVVCQSDFATRVPGCAHDRKTNLTTHLLRKRPAQGSPPNTPLCHFDKARSAVSNVPAKTSPVKTKIPTSICAKQLRKTRHVTRHFATLSI